MRHALLAAAVVVMLATPTLHAQPADTAADPVLLQLEAFRRNDYDLAYSFASQEIHSIFDRPSFERMVKTGYPEIAFSTRARVVERRIAADGHVFLLLKIRGANGQQVEALYEMLWESGAWKINSVVARPDPGEDV